MTATVHSFANALTQREFQEKVEHCDATANWYFAKATVRAKAEFDATMKSLLGCRGPKWDRARDAAKAKYQADTAEASALCDRTVECLMGTGEVSAELDALWTALINDECTIDRVAHAMAE